MGRSRIRQNIGESPYSFPSLFSFFIQTGISSPAGVKGDFARFSPHYLLSGSDVAELFRVRNRGGLQSECWVSSFSAK
jgi:hypothetical protein